MKNNLLLLATWIKNIFKFFTISAHFNHAQLFNIAHKHTLWHAKTTLLTSGRYVYDNPHRFACQAWRKRIAKNSLAWDVKKMIFFISCDGMSRPLPDRPSGLLVCPSPPASSLPAHLSSPVRPLSPSSESKCMAGAFQHVSTSDSF